MEETRLKITSTEMARHFSEYLSQVRYGGTTIIIEKNKAPVAEIRPLHFGKCTLKNFLNIWKCNSGDENFLSDLERVNRLDTLMEKPWD